MIPVTRTYLPPLEDYLPYLEKLWETGWITNNGELVYELEKKLREYLGVKHLIFLSNGTIAIQIVIKGLGLKGDIITTPFSYVATTSSIFWENCRPVFADIEPGTYCIDPVKVREKITPATSAILATHVYGNACDVEALDEISKEFNIPVIYDAAHAFGVTHKGTSLLNYGEVSTLSFHATKLFHTVEGGAIVTNDDQIAHRLEYMRRFGHDGPYNFQGPGINGKNSEIHAAMGLCVLPKMDHILAKRKAIVEAYSSALTNLKSSITLMKIRENTNWNYSYFPILFRSEEALIRVENALKENDIHPRRYFYPSLNTLDYLDDPDSMPISEDIASRILCLPLYVELELEDVERINAIIVKTIS